VVGGLRLGEIRVEENDGRSLEPLSCSCLAWAGTYLKLEMRRGRDGKEEGGRGLGIGDGGTRDYG